MILPSVLLGFFVALIICKFTIKRVIIAQNKLIAFGISWVWSALIANYANIGQIETKSIVSLIISISCTVGVVMLVTKK